MGIVRYRESVLIKGEKLDFYKLSKQQADLPAQGAGRRPEEEGWLLMRLHRLHYA